MFKKVLIANRGEIACRVIRTARAMGIETVAVHSDADADALHVQVADEAVAIGPAPSAESYLVIDRIVDACVTTGAEAVHPGYGFLSENVAFAQALDKAGIAFIGPDAGAIGAMGDKIEAKKLAQTAGVSTVPGHVGIVKDAKEAVRIAKEIGYPVMIKASAGGGGKGMRVAHSDAEVTESFRSAANEARSSFGDDRIFVEKFIEEPRHIEIQILADSHGNVIHLGERECSIQRRHQKVIEEAPSPFVDEATREAMGAQAVALANAVDYRSAGTVEFIVDKDRQFYFLEMNTRLQVEHPVTEMVTGIDLVEQMIRVAAGEKLEVAQMDVALKGWAIEARIYAEDPVRNFLPSIGRLVRYRPPEDDGRLRVDTGVYEGAEISLYYDPMIAKLIAYGDDRDDAIARLTRALDAYYIRGVSHNIGFLAAIAAHPRFREGRLSTNFIAEEYPGGFGGAQLPEQERAVLAALAAGVHYRYAAHDGAMNGQLPGRRYKVPDQWVVILDDSEYCAKVQTDDRGWSVALTGREVRIESAWQIGEHLFEGRIDGRDVIVQIDREGVGYRLFHGGAKSRALVLTVGAAALNAHMPRKEAPDTSKLLLSPMPGLLVSLAVEIGQEVKAGEALAVVEAMKMENVLRAERDGTVSALHADAGDSLAVDQPIVEFE